MRVYEQDEYGLGQFKKLANKLQPNLFLIYYIIFLIDIIKKTFNKKFIDLYIDRPGGVAGLDENNKLPLGKIFPNINNPQNKVTIEMKSDKVNNCEFIIVSNFRETRVYRCDILKYHTFYLKDSNMDDGKIKEFHLLLKKDNLIVDNGKSNFDTLLGSVENIQELKTDLDKKKKIQDKFYVQYKKIRKKILKNVKAVDVDKIINILDAMILLFFIRDRDASFQKKKSMTNLNQIKLHVEA